jgi:ABC-type sulfate/molybdate transport systems ATPase subunit
MTNWRVRITSSAGALNLEIDIDGSGEPLAIVGPNGSGKTTLLRAIAGAHGPAEGRIEIGDATFLDSSAGINLAAEDRGVGYVPQGYGLFPHLSVVENVAFGLSTGSRKASIEKRRSRALAALEELECTHLADRTTVRLSGGEAQRVALARALVIEPRILLLDEPVAALDATARRSVRAFLSRRLRALGRPSIVVTHDVRDVVALNTEVCVLEAGVVSQRGTVEELRASPATAFVAEFVGLD